jgi:hypothetical protein
MARPKDRNAGGGELRAQLLAEAEAMRDFISGPSPDPIDGRPNTSVDSPLRGMLYEVFDGPCRALRDGLAYVFPRDDLPDGHPLRYTGGRLYERLELGADDVLRELAD